MRHCEQVVARGRYRRGFASKAGGFAESLKGFGPITMTTYPSPSAGSGAETLIAAVVVTYNRRKLLELTLAGIAAGELTPHRVIVVNNASTDDTAEYLDSLSYPLPLDIVHLGSNMGGAGGFTVGIDRALVEHRADLVWVMDDDTEPTANTLVESYRAWKNYSPTVADRPAFVASRVVWENGSDHPMNTMRTMFGAGPVRRARAARVGARPVRSASFVSVLMDAAVMRRVGLPIADFFIWNDDFEYTTRLSRDRNAIATGASVALHHTATFGTTDAKPGPRFYYDVRNKLWVFCRRRTLTPLEKLLYGGSTLRLWVSTLARTDEKRVYAGYLLRGIRDSLRSFRDNTEVLAGVYDLQLPAIASATSTRPPGGRQFSVLMSTYAGDNPEFLDRAIASNTVEQTLVPDELVLVQDGPLPQDLLSVIRRWEEKSRSGQAPALTVVPLEVNGGLANALNAGLARCSFELVARADADDISLPSRFEVEIPLLIDSGSHLVCSAMYEVSEDGSEIESTRHAVSGGSAIVRALPYRNPIFHPTVVFYRSAVLAVGGYEEVPTAEDYWLWSRMHRAGFRFTTCPQPLVMYRTGAGAYTRRGGLRAVGKDYAVQRSLYSGGVIGGFGFARNLSVRLVYRLLPQRLRQKIFRGVIGSPFNSVRAGFDAEAEKR